MLTMAGLDVDACERARRSRDGRFDGRFFTAVATTGIYCRPVCPAASRARAENVRYFPSAAAAAAAGYRPCLRCRPEAAPGLPWTRAERAVGQAVGLIESGSLDGAGVAGLAAALGMSARQLRRAFQDCLGVAPKVFADHHRLQFARKLLAESELGMTEVALAAGFGSVRRFNAAFRDAFDTTPGTFRAHAARSPAAALRLAYRPPLNWQALTGFVGARAIPGVESVEGDCYRRAIALDGHAGWIEVAPLADAPALTLRIHFPQVSAYRAIVSRVRRQFDLDMNYQAVHGDLCRDPLLAGLMRATPGLRLPGGWDPFETTVRAVLGQQISVKAATTLAGRLAARYGEPLAGGPPGVERLFPTPEALADADLSGIGLTRPRAANLSALAVAIAESPELLHPAGNVEAFTKRLQALPGIGPWTAAYIAMRGLGEPDALPAADLGLMKATGLQRATEITERAEAWRPWRAYAAMHLWHSLAAGG